jgi:hypothetical protein
MQLGQIRYEKTGHCIPLSLNGLKEVEPNNQIIKNDLHKREIPNCPSRAQILATSLQMK